MKKILPILMLAVLVALPMKSAFAASVTVAVQQANAGGTAQTVTCRPLQQNCNLPFTVDAGLPTQQTVTINIIYTTSTVILSFKTPNGYYYARNMGGKIVAYTLLLNASLQGGKPATFNIGLFQPLAKDPVTPTSVSNNSHTLVTNLMITATPNP